MVRTEVVSLVADSRRKRTGSGYPAKKGFFNFSRSHGHLNIGAPANEDPPLKEDADATPSSRSIFLSPSAWDTASVFAAALAAMEISGSSFHKLKTPSAGVGLLKPIAGPAPQSPEDTPLRSNNAALSTFSTTQSSTDAEAPLLTRAGYFDTNSEHAYTLSGGSCCRRTSSLRHVASNSSASSAGSSSSSSSSNNSPYTSSSNFPQSVLGSSAHDSAFTVKPRRSISAKATWSPSTPLLLIDSDGHSSACGSRGPPLLESFSLRNCNSSSIAVSNVGPHQTVVVFSTDDVIMPFREEVLVQASTMSDVLTLAVSSPLASIGFQAKSGDFKEKLE